MEGLSSQDKGKETETETETEKEKEKEKEKETEKEKEKEMNELEETPQNMGADDMKPEEGMMFNSMDEAYNFYTTYAQKIGFGVKVRGTWRDKGDSEVTRCSMCCVREGKCDPQKNCTNAKKITSRIGCKARVNATLQKDGLWRLTKVELEHNHMVSPSKIKYFRYNKKLNKRVKKQFELNATVGIPISESFPSFATGAGGIDNLSFGERDARNYIDSARCLKLGEGDVEAIRQYFMRMQKKNSNFYHLMDIDSEGCLRNVFWADARSRASYQYFGDVIFFDTKYLTKRYGMPLVLFVGVNHHGQSILLGCGLLSSESMESYTWLFTAWLSCMSGQPPNAIITDQCKSIQGAVAEVFPMARHRLCLWHIMKKVPKKLGGFKKHEAIISKLKKTVYDSLKVEEFEQAWGEMVKDFALQDNEWLRSLYEIRQKWVPVFLKDQFWAGMSTTQRSENMSAFFDGDVSSKTSLKKFLNRYEVALEKKYEDEALADFHSFHKKHELISNLPLEKQLCSLYTSNIFAKFQEEVKNVVNCRYTFLSQCGSLFFYEVKERMIVEGISEAILKKFEVCFNVEKQEVQCICHSFESRGILCKHAICVLELNDVTELPSKYILQRWRKDFKYLHGLECSKEVDIFACAPMDRYDDIYMHCHKIAEFGSKSDMKYKFALNAIKKLNEECLAFHEEDFDSHPTGSVGYEEITTTNVIDLIQPKRKEQPRERLKSTAEKIVNAKKKKVSVGELNNIDQHEICLMQPTIETQRSQNIAENSQSIGSQVDINLSPSFLPMGDQGNITYQQHMFGEWMHMSFNKSL